MQCSAASELGEGEWEIVDEGHRFYGRASASTLRVNVAGKEMTFSTGVLARQASGAVTATYGETHVFASACFEKKDSFDPIDFTPLRVDYFERQSSAGRTPGGYIKRDGRPSAHETLVSRFIDRPIRPVIANGWSLETQLTAYVLAYDSVHIPDVLSMTASSAALAISEVPFPKPVAAVRVGMVEESPTTVHDTADSAPIVDPDNFDDDLSSVFADDDEIKGEEADGSSATEAEAADDGKTYRFVINPTQEEMARSKLNLVIAGTSDAVLMVEGFCDFLPEEKVLEAMELGLGAVKTLALAIGEWSAQCGAPKFMKGVRVAPEGVDEKVEAIVGDRIESVLCGPTKDDREKWVGLCDEAIEKLCPADGDGEYEKVDVKAAFKRLAQETLRQMGVRGVRQDGRTPTEVRPIQVQMSPLPSQVHGSALFTRGETQSLATVVFGDDSMLSRYENLDGEQAKRFYLQYIFPPFSVGEVGRNGAPGRREIGHGNLAEQAIVPSLPDEESFPYVIRVESLITESCGSSSMASVCGGCLALMAAGVPIERQVAGVAMGLLLDESGSGREPVILTDILGSEDALGTMDFKVAGDDKAITAFQLDIKCEGLSLPLMAEALAQARKGRLHILDIMREASPAPAATLAKGVPRLVKIKIPTSKVGQLIGPKGQTIKDLISSTGVENINVKEDGPEATVTVSGTEDDTIKAAIVRIEAIARVVDSVRAKPKAPPPEIKVGEKLSDCEIRSIVPFGIFVRIADGVDGFCHISNISETYVRSMDDLDIAEGSKIDVTVTQYNKERRQYRIKPVAEVPRKAAAAAG